MPTPYCHSQHRFPRHAHRLAGLALVTAGMLAASAAMAAGAAGQSDIDARYQRERAACEHSQDRAACLREAAAARDAARHNQLDEAQPDYERNALARCEALPPAERDLCRRRVHGEGETHGSVEGGGIYREYREITLPPLAPQSGERRQGK